MFNNVARKNTIKHILIHMFNREVSISVGVFVLAQREEMASSESPNNLQS